MGGFPSVFLCVISEKIVLGKYAFNYYNTENAEL